MEETQRSEEQKFRMNFKLSATQKWHGEFTVRANTEEELKANLEKCPQNYLLKSWLPYALLEVV